MCVRTHMAEAAPHHLELINQLLVQRTHFRVHQLLMHSKANSKDVNLWRNRSYRSRFLNREIQIIFVQRVKVPKTLSFPLSLLFSIGIVNAGFQMRLINTKYLNSASFHMKFWVKANLRSSVCLYTSCWMDINSDLPANLKYLVCIYCKSKTYREIFKIQNYKKRWQLINKTSQFLQIGSTLRLFPVIVVIQLHKTKCLSSPSPVPASGLWAVWSSLCLQDGYWCSPCQRMPGGKEKSRRLATHASACTCVI